MTLDYREAGEEGGPEGGGGNLADTAADTLFGGVADDHQRLEKTVVFVDRADRLVEGEGGVFRYPGAIEFGGAGVDVADAGAARTPKVAHSLTDQRQHAPAGPVDDAGFGFGYLHRDYELGLAQPQGFPVEPHRFFRLHPVAAPLQRHPATFLVVYPARRLDLAFHDLCQGPHVVFATHGVDLGSGIFA